MIRRDLIAAITAVAILSSGCGGGDDKVDLQSFASDFCSALSKWQSSVQDGASLLTEGLDPNITPEDGKQALSDFVDGVIGDTNTLIGETKEAGIPDIEKGEDVSDALISAFESAQSALEGSRDEIEALPTDPSAFSSAAQAIGMSVQSSLSDIGSDLGQKLDNLDAPGLEEAFDKAEGCSL